jgi:hypothetical protein
MRKDSLYLLVSEISVHSYVNPLSLPCVRRENAMVGNIFFFFFGAMWLTFGRYKIKEKMVRNMTQPSKDPIPHPVTN